MKNYKKHIHYIRWLLVKGLRFTNPKLYYNAEDVLYSCISSLCSDKIMTTLFEEDAYPSHEIRFRALIWTLDYIDFVSKDTTVTFVDIKYYIEDEPKHILIRSMKVLDYIECLED